jgi:hypothetical protein
MILKIAVDEVATPILETAFAVDAQPIAFSNNRVQLTSINNDRLIRYQGQEKRDIEVTFRHMRKVTSNLTVRETFDNMKQLCNTGVIYYVTIANVDDSVTNIEGWFELVINNTQQNFLWAENEFKLRMIEV